MNTKEDLRTDFHHVSGSAWLNSDDEPDIDYVEWLENKILSVLQSAKEEVKSAEEILKEKIIALPNGNIEDWEDGNKEHPDVLKALIKAMHEYASQFQSVQSKEVQLFMDDVHQWADSAFGKERTALAPVYHLKKEVDEVISEMKKGFPGLAIKELADCFILILNATSKYGYSFDKLFTEAKDKMIINKTRKWGKPDENGVCEHIKDQPVQSVKGEGEQFTGHWWCEKCKRSVPPVNVTFEEIHEDCGYPVEWIDAESVKGEGGRTAVKKIITMPLECGHLYNLCKTCHNPHNYGNLCDSETKFPSNCPLESYKHSESKDMYPKEKVIEFMWDAYKESNTVHEYESSLRAEFDEWVTTVI